jgi:axial budding pattern protein 2
MADISLLIIVLTFIRVVSAIPVANYPINAQLPPVARIAKPFNFTFSQGTFANGGTGLKYSLVNGPAWLQVDSSTSTLHGTPGFGDAGDAHFQLMATDQSGSASMSVTLVISKEPGPEPVNSLLPQLAKTGPTSSPATVFMYPGRPFTIAFNASEIFTNTHLNSVYYATSWENSPLPSWIYFDPSSLKFTGNSPSNPSSIPQTFTVNIVASDVAGFSAGAVNFEIVVGQHIMSFSNPMRTLNFTRGQPFSTPHFISDLTIDGHNPDKQNLTSIKIDGPSWLTVDNQTMSLSGKAPPNASNENVTITVTDIYQDTASLALLLRVSHLFSKGVSSCNATIGHDFSYTFDTSLFNDSAVKLDVDLGETSSWAKYDSTNRTLYGRVPDKLTPHTYSIKLTASQGSTLETRNLDLNTFRPGDTEVVNDQNSSGSGDSLHKRKVGIIAVAVVVPFVVAVTTAILLCLWCRRRRRTRAHSNGNDSEKLPASPTTRELPGSQPDAECMHTEQPEARRSSSSSSSHSVAPRLELGPLWETESLATKEEHAHAAQAQQENIPRATIVWDSTDKTTDENQSIYVSPKRTRSVSQTSPLSRRSTRRYSKREPLKPIQPRSFKRDSAMSSKSKRYSRRSSGLSSVASGLPVRLGGAGHGAGGFGPLRPELVRASWQTTQMSLQSDDTSIENLATMFPRPPRVRSKDGVSSRHSKRVSLRSIGATSPTPPEPDSLEAFIQGRARSRNSGNPLFSSRMNSRGSSGYRALDKARRSSSIAETTTSASTYPDDPRQSLYARPISTAMSASVYGDDNRNSTQVRPLSQMSQVDEMNAPRARGSLIQRYTDAIAQLPRFWSQGSMSSTRRFESGDSMTGSDDYYDLIDEREDPEGRRQWYRINSHTQPLSHVVEAPPDPRSPGDEMPARGSTDTSRVRRVSMLRTGGQDSSPITNRHWRLADIQERRPSVEDNGSLRQANGSFRGDLAFV